MIQNVMNETVNVHAHGEPVHTGTILNLWYIYQESILVHQKPVQLFIQRNSYARKEVDHDSFSSFM